MVKRGSVFVFVVSLLFWHSLRAQDVPASGRGVAGQTVAGQTVAGHTLVVIPFENASPTPGLEWLGESFPEIFHQQLNSPVLYVASREERLRAYDRQGIPAGVHASRATLYRLAEQMDVDYAVLGSYKYDGVHLTASAQLLDMRGEKLSPVVTESAALAGLGTLQSALAWDLLRVIRTDFSVPKDKYISSVASVRLDALENYIRGVLASTAEEKVQHYREAVRLNPEYAEAWLELGKTYYGQRAYEPAIAALGQVQQTSLASGLMSGAVVREANFYLGLAAYAHGDFSKSESAFVFVAARLPLAEVYNNLGVVAARRGRSQKTAADYFDKAIQNDPSDPDYHFNLGVTLTQAGDRAGAARELHTSLDRRPNDSEAKMLLDSLTPASAGSGIVASSATSKAPVERIKRNYEEDAFRQMTTQMGNWAEERFARSDPRAHARFHLELGKELLAHGFTTEAEAEFRHAAAVDPSSPAPLTALAAALAGDYDTRGDAREARAQAEAALRLRESAEAYLILARLDLRENRMEAAAQSIDRALQLEPGNAAGLGLKRTLAAKLAEKAQPLPQP
ncbi:MAG: tetratricopeptide repeat protein [Acidobacteriia bacterium]|nr:tetratricopeptide repeat protein [Terriglobia bacterium]